MAMENYQIYIECTLYILKEHEGAIYSSPSLRIAMIQYDDRIQSERTSYLYYRKWRRYSARPQCILVECGPLMLWRAEKTRDDIVGNSGQGIYWQGLDITHRPDETHRMGGLGTWRHAEGVPHACTARRTLLLEKITWGQVNPAREQMSPP